MQNRLLEGIKSFGYKPPKDPEKLLYDFYFMVGYLPQDHEDKAIEFVFREALNDCTINLQAHMLKALYWSLCAEIRHVWIQSTLRLSSSKSEGTIAALPDYVRRFLLSYSKALSIYSDEYVSALDPNRKTAALAKNRNVPDGAEDVSRGSRQEDYGNSFLAIEKARKSLKLSKTEAVTAMRYLYGDVAWDRSYGGAAWASIADGYLKLAKADSTQARIVYIDHAYDLQHNNGTVFTKLKSYYKEEDSYGWIAKALDWKRDQTDLRGFYSKVSSSLKPVVAWVAKYKYDLTIETYTSAEEKGATLVEYLRAAIAQLPTPVPSENHAKFLPLTISVGSLKGRTRKKLLAALKTLFGAELDQTSISEEEACNYMGPVDYWGVASKSPGSSVVIVPFAEFDTASQQIPHATYIDGSAAADIVKSIPRPLAEESSTAGSGRSIFASESPESAPVRVAGIDESTGKVNLANGKSLELASIPQFFKVGAPGASRLSRGDYAMVVPRDADANPTYGWGFAKPGRVYKVASSPSSRRTATFMIDGTPHQFVLRELAKLVPIEPADAIESFKSKVSVLPERFWVDIQGLSEAEVANVEKLLIAVSGDTLKWVDGQTLSKLPIVDKAYAAALGSLGVDDTGTLVISAAQKQDPKLRLPMEGLVKLAEARGTKYHKPREELTVSQLIRLYNSKRRSVSRRPAGITDYKGGSQVGESKDFHEFFKYREAVTMTQVGSKLLANPTHFARNMSQIQDFRISDLPAGIHTAQDLLYNLATDKQRGRVLSDDTVQQLKNLQAKHGDLKTAITAWLKANPDAAKLLDELLKQGVTAAQISQVDTGAVRRAGSAAQLQAAARKF